MHWKNEENSFYDRFFINQLWFEGLRAEYSPKKYSTTRSYQLCSTSSHHTFHIYIWKNKLLSLTPAAYLDLQPLLWYLPDKNPSVVDGIFFFISSVLHLRLWLDPSRGELLTKPRHEIHKSHSWSPNNLKLGPFDPRPRWVRPGGLNSQMGGCGLLWSKCWCAKCADVGSRQGLRPVWCQWRR